MKLCFISLLALFFLFGTSFAQDDLDFTNYTSMKQLEGDFEDLNNGVYAGMNALDWTDASAPSLFKFSADILLGFGSVGKNPDIGIKDDLFFPTAAGLQLGFGTAGFEAFARFMPETEAFSYKMKALGFGLKYEISDMIPVPGFPSVALFADYNTLDFGVNENRDVNGVKYKSKIDMSFSSVNIGTILSYDFVVARVFGKLGVDMGSTDLSWNSVVNNTENLVKGDLSGTGFRYSIGAALFGFRAEIGGRGSNMFAGLGYGISI